MSMVDETSMHANVLVVTLNVPTQFALLGANTTRPLPAVAAPSNLLLASNVVGHMSTQSNVLFVALNVPTHGAFCGAKTTRPFLATVTPENLSMSFGLIEDGMPTQVNALVTSLKMPTQLASRGANTATVPVVATPPNLARRQISARRRRTPVGPAAGTDVVVAGQRIGALQTRVGNNAARGFTGNDAATIVAGVAGFVTGGEALDARASSIPRREDNESVG
eukprot:7186477-Prymnesium_polylepis.3